MADVDIADAVEAVTLAENVGTPGILVAPVVVDAATITDVPTAPNRYFEFFRSPNAITVGLIDRDWYISDQYLKFRNAGMLLKGIILIPGSGGPDTFSIKDGSESGPYLYKAAVSAATVLVYPGTVCRPFIDYSECTLSAGHSVTFVW